MKRKLTPGYTRIPPAGDALDYNDSVPIPLLLVCYDRPKILNSLLLRIEELPVTKIYVAIDKAEANANSSKDNSSVIAAVAQFQHYSKHSVSVNVQQVNVGCNANTINGMDFLLTNHESGLLLEDDCEFSLPYIEFLNRNFESIDYSKYMSVTPMNLNWGRDLYYRDKSDVFFLDSVLMGASLGMTFSRESRVALNVALNQLESPSMFAAIKNFSRDCPVNFMQRKVLHSFFEGKAKSISKSWNRLSLGWSPHNETGWDSAWQLGAIFSNKLFLVPNFTLARETLNQEENQWHPHSFSYPSWENLDQEFTIHDLLESKPSKQPSIGAIHKFGIQRIPVKKYLALILREFKSKLRRK